MMLITDVSATADNGARVLFERLRKSVPEVVSVIVGSPINGVPSLVVMLSKQTSAQLPKRFRGMRVLTCLLHKRR
jgi:hypothetical protein